jgi:hypothetical protein
MTHTITADNVNQAYSAALHWLGIAGIAETSRNGAVLVAPGPVITTYLNPACRVLFSPMRDANPFFHLMESLWMLAGKNDVEFPATFNRRFTEYSDNGETINGAYGHRWREWFNYDQIDVIVSELLRNPDSRRCVLSMWDGGDDLRNLKSKDVPCNTHAYFDLRNGGLNMTVCCRSNDAVWGAYGANVVHFSILQEYIAAHVGASIGVYRQMSNNLHIYTDRFPHDKLFIMAQDAACSDAYIVADKIRPIPIISDPDAWDDDLHRFMSDPGGDTTYKEPFFDTVAAPMYAAWMDRKYSESNGLASAESIVAPDWRKACVAWILRREKTNESK